MGDRWCFVLMIISICDIVLSQVGNTCYMSSTGTSGICKISTDCPEVEEQSRNGIAPTLCGYFQLTTPIVCCEGSTFTDGGFQSPSRPASNSFSNSGNDNVNDKNNRPFQSRPIAANTNTDIYYSTERQDSNSNSDSIVYPSDININNDSPRKSESQCEIYTRPLNSVVQAIPLLTETDVINLSTEKCDNNGIPLIVGGEPAAPGEFPFMAALGFMVDGEIDWRCGATLISERYVITAAHCTSSRDADAPVVVRLGTVDLKKSGGRISHSDYNINTITVHPSYRHPQKYNDIALIRVDRSIKFTKYIRPACLYTSSYLEESLSIATGYGKEEFAAAENLNKLMKVALNIYDNDRCSQTFSHDRRNLPRGIISSMLCAGELKGGRDTCQGDSGGPLLVTKKGNQCKFYLIGITSFGKSCGEVNTPAVYTRVSEYLTWIEDIVWP